jgi:AcrR family transcriptional regulator
VSKPTREKILEASLSLFNALGERNVTTNHIADELGISPGNLYYHFRNKDDVVAQLFALYEARMDDALTRPRKKLPTLDDLRLQLQRMLECSWTYRFLHRDLVDILSRNRKLKQRYSRLLGRISDSIVHVLRGLDDAEILSATKDEIDATAENVLLAILFWLNHRTVRSGKAEPAQAELVLGVDQTMTLIAPLTRSQRNRI